MVRCWCMKKLDGFIGNINRRVMALIGAVVLVAGVVMPAARVSATEYGTGDYRLAIGVDAHADWVASLTVGEVDWESDADEFATSNGNYFLTLELHIPNEEVRDSVGVRTGGDQAERFSANLAGAIEDWGETHKKYTFTMTYEMAEQQERLSLMPYAEEGGESGEDDGAVFIWEDCDEVEIGCHAEIVPYEEGEESETTVLVRFSTLWHMKFVGEIRVNGSETVTVADYIDYDDQEDYLNHYGQQTVGFEVEIEKADNGVYEIEAETERNENMWIGNFLWTADPEQEYMKDCRPSEEDPEVVECEAILDEDGNPVPGKNYIGHSAIELVAVEYTLGGVKYACDGETGLCTIEGGEGEMACEIEEEDCGIPYLEFYSGSEEYDDGSLVVPAGARITMKIAPDYGYQVLNVNMAELETRDGVGEFTFTVPGGAAYFVADVVETEDVVATNSELVSGGNIDLGAGQTTLGQGSARLEVEDVELDEEEIEGFVEAAEGYEVKNYLNISLYNILCKGGASCEGTEDDAWSNQVKNLNEAATITLTLEDGVDGDDVVIVHEKDDGTFEVIPAEYDAETNTITFTTSSFSNYAIASRTVSEEAATETTPNTGSMTKDGTFGAKSGVGMIMGAGVMMVALGGVMMTKQRRE